jgi:hypothetical protein
VKICPATVIVAVRPLLALFGETVKETVPLPLPLVPEVIVMNPPLLVAVQAHPSPVVTVMLPAPPAERKARLVGEIE